MDEKLPAKVSAISESGLSSKALKYLAVVSMVIDHTALAFVPGILWTSSLMHFIGRIAAPVMFFTAVEGYQHTKNVNRYMARLAIFAVISYFPFIFFLAGAPDKLDFFRLNVIYTILLGVTAIRIRREIKNPVIKALLIIGLFILSFFGDWGMTGFLIMLVFDFYYGNFKNQAFTYCVVVILNIGVISAAGVLGQNLLGNHYAAIDMNVYINIAIKSGMFLPIIILRFYNQQKGSGGRFSKWFFYIFYPLHLLALGLARFLF